MKPLSRKLFIRKRRGTSWTPESSARANKARWKAEDAKREAQEPDRLKELAEIAAVNMPREQGQPVGCLQWHNFATGRIRRWTFKIGPRIGQYTMHHPDGRQTKPHGWTWFLNHLRGFLAGTKS